MSYSAPGAALLPKRQSIDTLSNVWALSTPDYTSTWPTANLAIYVPVIVPRVIVVCKLWFASSLTGAGNVDIGVYDAGGVAVISAANAAKIAADDAQFFDVTDTTLGPGIYYVGLSCDNNTDTFQFLLPTAPIPVAVGVLTEASAYPLPATATFAINQTLTRIPIVGMMLEATAA